MLAFQLINQEWSKTPVNPLKALFWRGRLDPAPLTELSENKFTPLSKPGLAQMTTRLQVAYCLTSSGDDIYEAMTRVSIATLRYRNTHSVVIVFCDSETHNNLKLSQSRLLEEADQVVAIDTPAGEPAFRNRFIKTQLRLLLSGPFLYLDSDTVVRRPLASIAASRADLALAPNHSADGIGDQICLEDSKALEQMGWQPHSPYFNGGVLWYADTANARRFAEQWHANWLENIKVAERYHDQPALNHTLRSIQDLEICCLDHRWNAQVKTPQGIHYATDAAIWHIYSSFDIAVGDLFSNCCSRLRHEKSLRPSSRILKKLLTADSPFISKEDSYTWKHRLAAWMKSLAGIPTSKS